MIHIHQWPYLNSELSGQLNAQWIMLFNNDVNNQVQVITSKVHSLINSTTTCTIHNSASPGGLQRVRWANPFGWLAKICGPLWGGGNICNRKKTGYACCHPPLLLVTKMYRCIGKLHRCIRKRERDTHTHSVDHFTFLHLHAKHMHYDTHLTWPAINKWVLFHKNCSHPIWLWLWWGKTRGFSPRKLETPYGGLVNLLVAQLGLVLES